MNKFGELVEESISRLRQGPGATLAGRRVLVTGGTGFIGSHLVRTLVALGADTTVLAPSLGWRPTVRNLVKEKKARYVRLGALWQHDSLRRAMAGIGPVDFVAHLQYHAPTSSELLGAAIEDVRTNIVGTLALMRCVPSTTLRFCFASSGLVYGRGSEATFDETMEPRPESTYGIGKLAIERHLQQYSQRTGIVTPVLRYTTVYGPMETAPRAVPNFIRKVLAGEAPVINGPGDDVRDYVHVQDVVEATVLALTAPTARGVPYNIGSGAGRTTLSIAEQVIAQIRPGLRPVHRTASAAAAKISIDISRARRELGYAPVVELQRGLEEEIRWFRNHPKLWRIA